MNRHQSTKAPKHRLYLFAFLLGAIALFGSVTTSHADDKINVQHISGAGGCGFTETFHFLVKTSTDGCIGVDLFGEDPDKIAAKLAAEKGLIADCYSCSDHNTYNISVKYLNKKDVPCPNDARKTIHEALFEATFTCGDGGASTETNSGVEKIPGVNLKKP